MTQAYPPDDRDPEYERETIARADIALEAVARAIEPATFQLPKINLYKEDYDRAFAKARAAIDAYTAAWREVPYPYEDFPI